MESAGCVERKLDSCAGVADHLLVNLYASGYQHPPSSEGTYTDTGSGDNLGGGDNHQATRRRSIATTYPQRIPVAANRTTLPHSLHPRPLSPSTRLKPPRVHNNVHPFRSLSGYCYTFTSLSSHSFVTSSLRTTTAARRSTFHYPGIIHARHRHGQ